MRQGHTAPAAKCAHIRVHVLTRLLEMCRRPTATAPPAARAATALRDSIVRPPVGIRRSMVHVGVMMLVGPSKFQTFCGRMGAASPHPNRAAASSTGKSTCLLLGQRPLVRRSLVLKRHMVLGQGRNKGVAPVHTKGQTRWKRCGSGLRNDALGAGASNDDPAQPARGSLLCIRARTMAYAARC